MQAPTPTPSDYLNFKAVLQARRAARALNLQPASARHVLEVVAGYSNGTPAMPSYQTLADDTGLGAYQVRALIDRLVEAGYLAETRATRKGGGWGKPMWALGPTCQVWSTPHMPETSVATAQVGPTPHTNGQVLPTPHSSVATATLASVATATPKRITVDHGDSVVPEETLEEKDPPTPQPAKPPQPYTKADQTKAPIAANGTRVGDYIAYLTNHGHEDMAKAISVPDKVYLNSQQFDIEDFAACMVATVEGKWAGADAWIQRKLTIVNVHRYRYPQWVTRGARPAASTADDNPGGHIGAMRAFLDSFPEEPAHDQRPVLRALPAPDPALRAP